MNLNAPTAEFHEAKWWKKDKNSGVVCFLCPRVCSIANGKYGFCSVRKNIDGKLYSTAYAHPVAIHIDPIEKKPLAEFLPGTKTFSIGCFGCNLNCSFCQNYQLSRGKYDEVSLAKNISPDFIINETISNRCPSVSFTYNEPTIWAEYMIDIATVAKSKNIATVMVSNGYIGKDAANEVYPLIDAANIDMKGFSENFYQRLTGGKLRPVLDSMELFHNMGKHLEITNLVIPGENDSAEMVEPFLSWVKDKLSLKIPIHFSAYFPCYKYLKSPTTPPATLRAIKAIAEKMGFKHVYLGNILNI
jgi:pyruvate formate lyase activating enzyme